MLTKNFQKKKNHQNQNVKMSMVFISRNPVHNSNLQQCLILLLRIFSPQYYLQQIHLSVCEERFTFL